MTEQCFSILTAHLRALLGFGERAESSTAGPTRFVVIELDADGTSYSIFASDSNPQNLSRFKAFSEAIIAESDSISCESWECDQPPSILNSGVPDGTFCMPTNSNGWTQKPETWICLYSRNFEFRTHLTLADLKALQSYHFKRVTEFTAVSQDNAADWFCERFGFRVASDAARKARKHAGIM